MDEREPIAAPREECDLLAALDRALQADPTGTLAVTLPSGEQMALPTTVAAILRRAVRELARDRAVQLLTVGRDLTTQQAADLLNVSRPYLIQLLDSGTIPHHMAGTHRRVPLDALLAYRREEQKRRRELLRELTQLSEEWGMYDLPPAPRATKTG